MATIGDQFMDQLGARGLVLDQHLGGTVEVLLLTHRALECRIFFQQALEWARRQQALSWELRAATSLARLAHQLGRDAEAAELLFSVYDRFSEGFVTG